MDETRYDGIGDAAWKHDADETAPKMGLATLVHHQLPSEPRLEAALARAKARSAWSREAVRKATEALEDMERMLDEKGCLKTN